MQTIVLLRGTTCVGKTTVRMALEHRQLHLLKSPLLEDIATAGFAQFDVAATAEILAGTGDPVSLVARCIGDKPYLLSDLWGGEHGNDERLLPALSEKYRVVRVLVICLPWLVAARRKFRLACIPDDGARLAELTVTTKCDLLDFYAAQGVEVVCVDTSDYPIREVCEAEARLIMEPPDAPEVGPLEPSKQYQQALRVQGVWHGAGCPPHEDLWARQEWEWSRLQVILPKSLAGQTVIDIGASEGGMCYEALHRGAQLACAVEIREPQLAIMRHIREAARLPLTTANVDVFTHAPPPLKCHGAVERYDLGLVLNVLHHAPDPEPVLRRILDACDALVVETPSGTGDAPYKPGVAPYPHAWHLPWAWMQRQGEAAGFRLENITVGPYYPEQRLIFKFRREA